MKKYKQLTSEQRYQIYGLKQAGLKQSRIAEKVGVDKSTISREFRGRSPHEVLFGVKMRYTKPPLAVSLRA